MSPGWWLSSQWNNTVCVLWQEEEGCEDWGREQGWTGSGLSLSLYDLGNWSPERWNSHSWAHRRKRLDTRSPDHKAELFCLRFCSGSSVQQADWKRAIITGWVKFTRTCGHQVDLMWGRLLKVDSAQRGVVCEGPKYCHTEVTENTAPREQP